jgi:adenylate kinase/ribonuclease R
MAVRRKNRRKKTGARTARKTRKRITRRRSGPELPSNLTELWRQVLRGLREFEKRLEKAREQREAFWRRREEQTRREILKLVRRVEKAISGSQRKKAASRKKTSRKKATRRKAVRKSSTRKKTTRKRRASRA